MVFEIRFLVFLFPLLLILFALYFFSGRGGFLISGYNTLPPEEKARYNLKELTRAMGIFTVGLAVLMAWTLYMGMIAENMVLALAGLIGIAVFTVFWIYYLNAARKIKAHA